MIIYFLFIYQNFKYEFKFILDKNEINNIEEKTRRLIILNFWVKM